MKIFRGATGSSRLRMGKEILVSLFSLALLFATWPQNLSASQDAQAPAQAGQGQPTRRRLPSSYGSW
jgi:hypothetical protein